MMNRAEELRRTLIAGERGMSGNSVEATVDVESVPQGTPLARDNRILDRIDAAFNATRDPNIDERAFIEALSLFYRNAEPALAKMTQGGTVAVTPDEQAVLEAIIIADGKRPSFLLTDGLVALDDPFLGSWGDLVAAHAPAMQRIARATGRVQPGGGHASRFVGTATLIDAARSLALTNFHVVDDARNKHGVAMEQKDRRITVTDAMEVDFIGEAKSFKTNRFRVVAVDLPEHFGRGHGSIDAAMLHLEPLDGGALPAAVAPFSPSPHLAQGAILSLATIGFPGPPAQQTGTTGNVDWAFVVNTLFAGKFGMKRLAPGRFTLRLGSHPSDTAQTAFGHDATTFGGASGSSVIAWAETGAPIFGLHFAGKTESANHALSAGAAQDALAAIGVRFG